MATSHRPVPANPVADAAGALCSRHDHPLSAASYEVPACNPLVISARLLLPLLGTTLRVIPRRAEAACDCPGGCHSSLRETGSFRSSVLRSVDRRAVFSYANFIAVVYGPIWGNGLCRSSLWNPSI
jgi:hypothetical protein